MKKLLCDRNKRFTKPKDLKEHQWFTAFDFDWNKLEYFHFVDYTILLMWVADMIIVASMVSMLEEPPLNYTL